MFDLARAVGPGFAAGRTSSALACLAQQFEFVQQNWINSTKFEGLLYASSDPITGPHDPEHPERDGSFTVQASPVRWRVTGVPQFVDVRGGAYFFMPSIRSVAYLSELD